MAIVVVGGPSRGVGKTSTACALIAATKERHWTAIKLTMHAHQTPEEARRGNTPVFYEETHSGEKRDTERYLAAGAARAFWVRLAEGDLRPEWLPVLREQIGSPGNLLLESNQILSLLRPNLCLAVLDGANPDWKDSTGLLLEKADALLVAGPANPPASFGLPAGIPVFRTSPPDYLPPEALDFVQQRLLAATGTLGG